MLEEKIYLNWGKITLFVFVFCLLTIGVVGFDVFTAKARDIRRRADVDAVAKALDLYHLKYGRYPEAADDWQEWDLSYDLKGETPEFLKILREEGFLANGAKDPINNSFYHYRYRRYEAGDFGCTRSFYILQVSAFEMAAKNTGRGECPDYNWADKAPNGYTMQGFE